MNFEELAKKIGTIRTGEAVSAEDIKSELRAKSYVVHNGELSPSEMFRLRVYAKRRAIKRLVDQSFIDDAKAKQVVQPKRDTAQAMRRSELIDQALATAASRRPLALAKGVDPLFDRETQKRFKLEAWANYRAGLIR